MKTPSPWYKQFWPWFLICLPMSAVIASVTTMFIAVSNSDPLVVDDYYKVGKAINQDIQKTQNARQQDLSFSMIWKPTPSKQADAKIGEIIISQKSGNTYNAALNVDFYHSTLAEKDFKQLVTADGLNKYRIPVTESLNGVWEVKLESFDHQWRLQKRVNLTANTPYLFD